DDVRGYDVGGMDQHLRHVERRAFELQILDGVSADPVRRSRVATGQVRNRAGLDGGSNGERLEGRAQLVDLVGDLVEDVFAPFVVDVVGVELGKRGERHDLAGIHV